MRSPKFAAIFREAVRDSVKIKIQNLWEISVGE